MDSLSLTRITTDFNSFPTHLGFQVCASLSLPTSSSSFLPFWWLLGERRLHLGHRASALLSRLSLLKWRLVEMRGLTRSFSAPWRIIKGTSRSSLRGKWFQGDQFLPIAAFHIWGPLQSDGLATNSYDFGADFPNSGACILFEGYIWTRWPYYFHR